MGAAEAEVKAMKLKAMELQAKLEDEDDDKSKSKKKKKAAKAKKSSKNASSGFTLSMPSLVADTVKEVVSVEELETSLKDYKEALGSEEDPLYVEECGGKSSSKSGGRLAAFAAVTSKKKSCWQKNFGSLYVCCQFVPGMNVVCTNFCCCCKPPKKNMVAGAAVQSV